MLQWYDVDGPASWAGSSRMDAISGTLASPKDDVDRPRRSRHASRSLSPSSSPHRCLPARDNDDPNSWYRICRPDDPCCDRAAKGPASLRPRIEAFLSFARATPLLSSPRAPRPRFFRSRGRVITDDSFALFPLLSFPLLLGGKVVVVNIENAKQDAPLGTITRIRWRFERAWFQRENSRLESSVVAPQVFIVQPIRARSNLVGKKDGWAASRIIETMLFSRRLVVGVSPARRYPGADSQMTAVRAARVGGALRSPPGGGGLLHDPGDLDDLGGDPRANRPTRTEATVRWKH